MSITIVDGSLFDTSAKYICHQVNCCGRMGSGVAKQVRSLYPEAYKEYMDKCKDQSGMLGDSQFILCHDGKVIVNMFAQGNYGYDGKLYTDYSAFQNCLIKIRDNIPVGESIAMPYKIGCGLGGGDWNKVLSIITSELDGQYVVELWRI